MAMPRLPRNQRIKKILERATDIQWFGVRAIIAAQTFNPWDYYRGQRAKTALADFDKEEYDSQEIEQTLSDEDLFNIFS